MAIPASPKKFGVCCGHIQLIFDFLNALSIMISTMYVLYVCLPPANEVWGKVIFLHQFVILFTGGGVRGCSRGTCMVAQGGMHGCSGGHAWLLWGGVRGCSRGRGVCVVARGACMVALGGMHGFIWGGVRGFIWRGMRGFFSFFGYNEIRSMSGRYASYWNAFLS